MGALRDNEIWACITRKMDLWERILHTVLVWDADAEGAAMEGRVSREGKEEEYGMA